MMCPDNELFLSETRRSFRSSFGSSNGREDLLSLPTFWVCEAQPNAGCYTSYYHQGCREPKKDDFKGREALPDWWKFEFRVVKSLNPILEIAFRILCLVSLGHARLGDVWDICNSDEDTWLRAKDRLWNRVNSITIVAGLLLGSTAAFATTTPPRPELVDYAALGSYRCIMASFGITLGGLVVGSAMLFVMSKCRAKWSCDTLMGSRSRVYCTLFIIAYPFIAVGVSTAVLAFGIIAAAWRSQDHVIRVGSSVLLVCFMASLFTYTQVGSHICPLPLLIWMRIKSAAYRSVRELRERGLWRARRSALTAAAPATV
ncbi:hypothetical protein EVG20_g8952 [Dentipellis fragilis]|uniref:Uncharacterized protein n=1 Tax=Dentipellis fragilis TaxID=205917 RepID=A0A4Y9Y362_9AGAM|nr:hypothetical protein EVG20_g8952 [Dentipellis fragilis]